jgi:prophage regulatory protein
MPQTSLPLKRIIRLPEVTETTGISRSTLYRLVRARLFPAPLRLGKSAIGWTTEAIQQWIAERESAAQ